MMIVAGTAVPMLAHGLARDENARQIASAPASVVLLDAEGTRVRHNFTGRRIACVSDWLAKPQEV